LSNAYFIQFPGPLVLPEFDEYQREGVLEHSLPGGIETIGACELSTPRLNRRPT
jgi:hypothetical protein